MVRFIAERTLRRPRDVIAFVNEILGANESEILPLSKTGILKAEASYSRKRLEALIYEWRAVHALIRVCVELLSKFEVTGCVRSFDEESLLDVVVAGNEFLEDSSDRVLQLTKEIFKKTRGKEGRLNRLALEIAAMLHKAGAIGLKLSSTEGVIFSYRDRLHVDASMISLDTKYVVSPAFHSALNIRGRAVRGDPTGGK